MGAESWDLCQCRAWRPAVGCGPYFLVGDTRNVEPSASSHRTDGVCHSLLCPPCAWAHASWGESVLIHSGSGGVGQAAISIALSMGCTVFTTVGSEEKREFLLRRYPQLEKRSVANSRDLSFEKHVLQETKGK
ncbi:hypothetical protein MTO96_043986, partial [Rhipicephalus appendiculatus]